MMALSLRDRLRTLTVIELKKELKEQFSAIQTGVKEDLVERLACLIEREQTRTTDPSKGKKISLVFNTKTLVLRATVLTRV